MLLSTLRRFCSTRRTFSSTTASTKRRSTGGKYAQRTAFATIGLAAFYVTDKEVNASSISRNLRTLWTCAVVAADYKLNFQPGQSERIPALHERVANRVFNLMTSNGGLYIKIGQAIGANPSVLPGPFQRKFASLFDDAPQIPYSTVVSVFQSEFGRPPSGPDGVFEVFEENALASASLAQVHRAKLKGGGDEWVAVKVQKPDVSKQVEWDLGAFRIVMWMYEHWVFNLPVYFVVDFVSDHFRRELDFEEEARNAKRTAAFVAAEPRLANRVYVPRVYPEYSTKKVMTAEWIDGVRLSDKEGIRRLMGEDDHHSDRDPRTEADSRIHSLSSRPLRGGVKSIMDTMVELFSAQMFSWGWVHCDPHPGNVIIRPHPSHPGFPQLVLIDHGLYVRLTEEFRKQYALLWKSLLTLDYGTVKEIGTGWGIGSPDLFASATLQKPVGMSLRNGGGEKLDQYEMSVRMKEKLRAFLSDTDKMPKELIFIGRNMRIVQGNNQALGSPVNRINITGHWASRSLTASPSLTFSQRFAEYTRHAVFLWAMFSIDVAFWVSKTRQWVRTKMTGVRGGGFEDDLERGMRWFAKDNFGLEIAEGAFDG